MEALREAEQKQQEAVTEELLAEGDRPTAPIPGGDACMDEICRGDATIERDLVGTVAEDNVNLSAGATDGEDSTHRRRRRLIAYVDVCRRGRGDGRR